MNNYENMKWEELIELPHEELITIPKSILDKAYEDYFKRAPREDLAMVCTEIIVD